MLTESIFSRAAEQPSTVAVVDDRGKYTFAQLAAMASMLRRAVSDSTGQPRIGLLLPPGAGFVASFYGALMAGKAVVPINYLLGDREIAHCVADSGIDVVVSIPQLAGRLKGLALKVIDLTQLASAPAGSQQPDLGQPSPAADDLAVLMYTSGTSGLPKGVLLTYGNLQSSVDGSIAHMNFQSTHRFLGVIPLFHVFGMVATMLAPIQLGATTVYLSRFSPLGVVNAIREHGISLMLAVPSMYAALLHLKEASAADFKGIYAMISGGEPLPTALCDAFEARFGVTLLDAYGMTETSLGIALNTPTVRKSGSVGKPLPGAEVRIVDDTGHDVGLGQPGEIWVRGPMVMKGYHKLPAETAAAITPDGYFKTGDLGMFNADGFLHLTGRKKDLIIVSGEKVSPGEIEAVLTAHPAVADAAVVGRKDKSRGEVVAAFVTIRGGQATTAQELRDFCRQRLPAWKVPREVRIIDAMPRSPTGKILRRELVQDSDPADNSHFVVDKSDD
jgi:long-chain acyl-CoA synthetase